MNDNTKKTVWFHLVSGARDIIVVITVLSILLGFVGFAFRPYWEPFAELPAKVAEIEAKSAERERLFLERLGELQATLNKTIEPQIVEFEGKPQLVNGPIYRPGETIRLLYFLRRNATCITDVEINFYDVDRNVFINFGVREAVRAPVTRKYIPFPVDVVIPQNIRPGRYVYAPDITPIDCGVYGTMSVIPSQIFTIE